MAHVHFEKLLLGLELLKIGPRVLCKLLFLCSLFSLFLQLNAECTFPAPEFFRLLGHFKKSCTQIFPHTKSFQKHMEMWMVDSKQACVMNNISK